MTDLYIDDDAEQRPGALEQLRAEVSRAVSRFEHGVRDYTSAVGEETRFLVRRTQHKINSRLGTAALVALGLGLVLGLAAAMLSAHRGDRP